MVEGVQQGPFLVETFFRLCPFAQLLLSTRMGTGN